MISVFVSIYVIDMKVLPVCTVKYHFLVERGKY